MFVYYLNNIVCSAYTDVVVKLSATLPDVPGAGHCWPLLATLNSD